MRKSGRLVLSIFFVLGVSLVPVCSVFAQAIIVKEIEIQGSRRVQETVIRARIQTKVGDQFVPARLSEDIKAIFGLGFFDDVQLRVEDFEGGVKVTFVVAERPFIRDVDFTGNTKLATDT